MKSITLDQFLTDAYLRHVNEMHFSVRVANCLNNANISYVGELALYREFDLLDSRSRWRNFGKKSFDEIVSVLRNIGVELGTTVDGFAHTRQDLRRHLYEENERRWKLTCLQRQLANVNLSGNSELIDEILHLYSRTGIEVTAGQPMPDEVKREMVGALKLARQTCELTGS